MTVPIESGVRMDIVSIQTPATAWVKSGIESLVTLEALDPARRETICRDATTKSKKINPDQMIYATRLLLRFVATHDRARVREAGITLLEKSITFDDEHRPRLVNAYIEAFNTITKDTPEQKVNDLLTAGIALAPQFLKNEGTFHTITSVLDAVDNARDDTSLARKIIETKEAVLEAIIQDFLTKNMLPNFSRAARILRKKLESPEISDTDIADRMDIPEAIKTKLFTLLVSQGYITSPEIQPTSFASDQILPPVMLADHPIEEVMEKYGFTQLEVTHMLEIFKRSQKSQPKSQVDHPVRRGRRRIEQEVAEVTEVAVAEVAVKPVLTTSRRRGRPAKELPPETLAAIKEQYARGDSIQSIVNQLEGVGYEKVRKVLISLGAHVPKKLQPRGEYLQREAHVLALRASDPELSFSEIARRVGADPEYVRLLLIRSGLHSPGSRETRNTATKKTRDAWSVKIIVLRKANPSLTMTDIANQVGAYRDFVIKVLVKAGLYHSLPKQSPDVYRSKQDEVRALDKSNPGMSERKIAEATGMSKTFVRNALGRRTQRNKKKSETE